MNPHPLLQKPLQEFLGLLYSGHSKQQPCQILQKLSESGAKWSLVCFHLEKGNYECMELNLLGWIVVILRGGRRLMSVDKPGGQQIYTQAAC